MEWGLRSVMLCRMRTTQLKEQYFHVDVEDVCQCYEILTGGRGCLIIKSGYCDNFPQMKNLNPPKGSVWAGGYTGWARAAGWGFSAGRSQCLPQEIV